MLSTQKSVVSHTCYMHLPHTQRKEHFPTYTQDKTKVQLVSTHPAGTQKHSPITTTHAWFFDGTQAYVAEVTKRHATHMLYMGVDKAHALYITHGPASAHMVPSVVRIATSDRHQTRKNATHKDIPHAMRVHKNIQTALHRAQSHTVISMLQDESNLGLQRSKKYRHRVELRIHMSRTHTAQALWKKLRSHLMS